MQPPTQLFTECQHGKEEKKSGKASTENFQTEILLSKTTNAVLQYSKKKTP